MRVDPTGGKRSCKLLQHRVIRGVANREHVVMPNQQCQRVNPRKARPAGRHDEVGRSVGGGGVGAFLWPSSASLASAATALANRRTGRRHKHSPTRLRRTDVGRWLKSTTSLGAQETMLTAPVADHRSRNRSRTLIGTGQVAQTIAA